MRASARLDRGVVCQCPAGLAPARTRAAGAWSLVLLIVLMSASLLTRAEDRISVSRATVSVRSGADPGTFVDAQFDFELPLSLREAVDHGIALYFVIELEVSRSRWYWFDKRLLDDSIQYRLSFSPLTRQYRLARGALAQPFDSLDQALATMRRVTQWRVADTSLFDSGKTWGQIRMRLDTSLLPKPFQVNALTDPDWVLASDWSRLSLASDNAH
jgi:hypothetical protein